MFDSLVYHLEDRTNTTKISLSAYRKWQKYFSFDALKGKHYGQSFSDYFKIQDYRILYESNWEKCDALIKREWITNHAPCGI